MRAKNYAARVIFLIKIIFYIEKIKQKLYNRKVHRNTVDFSVWSERRESNPHIRLGKPMFCH